MEQANEVVGTVGQYGGQTGILILMVFMFVLVSMYFIGKAFMVFLKQLTEQNERWMGLISEQQDKALVLQKETNEVLNKLSDKIEPCKYYQPRQ